jgi:hypothetical protein
MLKQAIRSKTLTLWEAENLKVTLLRRGMFKSPTVMIGVADVGPEVEMCVTSLLRLDEKKQNIRNSTDFVKTRQRKQQGRVQDLLYDTETTLLDVQT